MEEDGWRIDWSGEGGQGCLMKKMMVSSLLDRVQDTNRGLISTAQASSARSRGQQRA